MQLAGEFANYLFSLKNRPLGLKKVLTQNLDKTLIKKCTCSTETDALGHVAGAAVEADAVGLAAVAPVARVAGIAVARGPAVRSNNAPKKINQ